MLPVVSTSMILDSSIESFDAAAFRASLLRRFRRALNVTLVISPASIQVNVSLVMATEEDADELASELVDTPRDTLAQSLSTTAMPITIEEPLAAPSIALAVVSSELLPSSTGAGDDSPPIGRLAGVVVGVGILATAVLCLWHRWRQVHEGASQLLDTAPSGQVRKRSVVAQQYKPSMFTHKGGGGSDITVVTGHKSVANQI